MQELLDQPYAQPVDPKHTFDLYVPDGAATRPLIVFVHGGAWHGDDKADHAPTARRLAAASNCAVAVPNYRLTTAKNELRHPAHAQDILRCLEHLRSGHDTADSTSGLGHPSYDATRLILLGHSCGAHILHSIFLLAPEPVAVLAPSDALLAAVDGIVTSEGIYDVDLMLADFPETRNWFFARAFGDLPSYAHVSTTNAVLRREGIRWLLIHSKGDTLVNQPQTDAMYDHLVQLANSELVQRDYEFTEEHDDVLSGERYTDVVSKFVG